MSPFERLVPWSRTVARTVGRGLEILPVGLIPVMERPPVWELVVLPPFVLVTRTEDPRGPLLFLLRLLGTGSAPHVVSDNADVWGQHSFSAARIEAAGAIPNPPRVRAARVLSPRTRQLTTKVKLFLAPLFPPPAPACISTVWVPEESLLGVKLRLPVVRRY